MFENAQNIPIWRRGGDSTLRLSPSGTSSVVILRMTLASVGTSPPLADGSHPRKPQNKNGAKAPFLFWRRGGDSNPR